MEKGTSLDHRHFDSLEAEDNRMKGIIDSQTYFTRSWDPRPFVPNLRCSICQAHHSELDRCD